MIAFDHAEYFCLLSAKIMVSYISSIMGWKISCDLGCNESVFLKYIVFQIVGGRCLI